MSSIVSIRACASYDPALVSEAVASALGALEAAFAFPNVKGKIVLLKPNMLIAVDKERAVSTHPEILRAAIREFKKRGAEVWVGESPAVHGSLFAAKKCGLLPVSEAEGARWVDFTETVMVENPQGVLVKRFELAKAAVDADVVVSLPKLKTHQLMYFTGAMKNLFGCVSGLQKAAYHFRYPERKDFGTMITDLCLALKPAFSLMDAVVAMEGKGPGNGDPRKLGLIMASSDILALDWAASSIIGYNPAHIPNQADALTRGPWLRDPSDLTIDGPALKDLAVHDFKRVHEVGDVGIVRKLLPPLVYRYIQNILTPRPLFRDDRCLRCGECITLCPAKVLSFVPARAGTWGRQGSPAGLSAEKAAKRVSIDYGACLRCYCCHEVCPADAITLRRG